MENNRKITACLIIAFFIIFCIPLGALGSDDILVVSAIPQTGPYASDGEQMQKSLEMAVDEYNAKGGILGRKVKVKFGDVGALEPEKIQAVGERLMGLNPDAVITGYDDSGVNTHVFGKYKQPYLHGVAMTEATKPVAENPEYRNCFQYTANETVYGINAAAVLFDIPKAIDWKEPNKKVAIIAADYSYNILGGAAFKEDAEAKGYKAVINEIVPFGVAEWRPMLSRIKKEKPAYITLWSLAPDDMARFMIQFREMFKKEGFDALIYMQYTPNIPEFLELAKDSGEGVIWSTVAGIVGPGAKEYTARWKKRYNELPKSLYAHGCRDAFDIWAKAVEEAGCVDCYDLVNEKIRNMTYSGFMGVIKFKAYDQSIYSGDDTVPTIWSQVWNGKNNNRTGPAKYAEFAYKRPPWLP